MEKIACTQLSVINFFQRERKFTCEWEEEEKLRGKMRSVSAKMCRPVSQESCEIYLVLKRIQFCGL